MEQVPHRDEDSTRSIPSHQWSRNRRGVALGGARLFGRLAGVFLTNERLWENVLLLPVFDKVPRIVLRLRGMCVRLRAKSSVRKKMRGSVETRDEVVGWSRGVSLSKLRLLRKSRLFWL
ncbi:hypothetical protein KCV07_g411, partial [Aureobasidium melanogenum]